MLFSLFILTIIPFYITRHFLYPITCISNICCNSFAVLKSFRFSICILKYLDVGLTGNLSCRKHDAKIINIRGANTLQVLLLNKHRSKCVLYNKSKSTVQCTVHCPRNLVMYCTKAVILTSEHFLFYFKKSLNNFIIFDEVYKHSFFNL
jgi:hypothetical protein